MFDRFRKLGRIHKEEEGLMLDLLSRSITVEEYLQRYDSIATKILGIGDVVDSRESLTELLSEKKYLGVIPLAWCASDIVAHECEHAQIAEQYGVSSRFIYVSAGVRGCVYTWYPDLHIKARDWTIEQLDEFCKSTENVSRPSSLDKRYEKMRRKLH